MAGRNTRRVGQKRPARKQSAITTIGNFLKKNSAVLGAESLRRSMLARPSSRIIRRPPKRR